MSFTITKGLTIITPTLVLGFESKQASSTQIHLALGASIPGATTRPAIARSGTLRLLFTTEADADECRYEHTTAGTLTLATTDLSTADMTYVAIGDVTMKLDDATLNAWLVEVGYQEV